MGNYYILHTYWGYEQLQCRNMLHIAFANISIDDDISVSTGTKNLLQKST